MDLATLVKLTVMNTENNQLENIEFNKELYEGFGVRGEDMTARDQDLVSMILYIKDNYNISENGYHELASLCCQMPRHYCLKQRITELNTKWNIRPTPAGTKGDQQSLTEFCALKDW